MPPADHDYPRPHFDRSHSWLSLDGAWQFASADGGDPATPATTDLTEGLAALEGARTISVPFAWQTPASGIAEHWLAGAWYRRQMDIPAGWDGQRVVLHFGAVHHEALVWVDGEQVAHHVGGYTPFSADITGVLRGDTVDIVVRVLAPLDQRDLVHGKQRSVPRDDYDGVAFTPSSGIWQSVWLEARPATHLTSLRLTPGADLDRLVVRAAAAGPDAAGGLLTLRLREENTEHRLSLGADGTASGEIMLGVPRLWSPADPHLYHVDAEFAPLAAAGEIDRVTVYTGLRRIEVVGEQLHLNGQRLFVRGVLDQGYWPRSGITPPDDQALRRDLELAAAAGYNLVRKHLKIEDPRFLRHADELGMLVWAEPASTGRFSTASVEAFAAQIAPMVERDANSPAIIIWGLYNEEWGLDWDLPGDPAKQRAAVDAYELLKHLDDSRPAVENSGWAHVRTDLLDWHYYDESPSSWARTVASLLEGTVDDFPVKVGPDTIVRKALAACGQPLRGLPNLNSEYGGGYTSVERGWHLRWQTQEMRRHDRLAGYVYTELYDVEHESAGLLTFDRSPKDLGGVDPADANAETTLVLDVTPVAPGRDLLTTTADLVVPVRVSHHGTQPARGHLVTAWTPVFAPAPADGSWRSNDAPEVEAKPFFLSEPTPVRARLPDGWVSGRLHLALITDDVVMAMTCMDVDTRCQPHVGDDPHAVTAHAGG